jgi:hypothetical protein
MKYLKKRLIKMKLFLRTGKEKKVLRKKRNGND